MFASLQPRRLRATTDTPPADGTRRARLLTRVLAGVGVLILLGLVVGLIADVRSFDRTRGGTEAPYTGWTGTPIDWTAADVTNDGFRHNGYVTDVTVDCTTGMITFEAFGLSYDWRTVSGRAIAVHKPREACAAAGFSPRF